MATNCRDILIVGTGRIGSHFGSQLIEGVLHGEYALGRIWYLGRTVESAYATLLDHRDELILRALLEPTRDSASKFIEMTEQVAVATPSTDLSSVRVVALCFGVSRRLITEDRDSLFTAHEGVLSEVAKSLRNRISDNALWLSVVNPIERICETLCDRLNLNKQRVVGVGATHDSARFADVLHKLTGKKLEEIVALRPHVVGPHNDQMLPVWNDKLGIKDKVTREYLTERTRARGLDILRGRGISPVFAPARALYLISKALMCGGTTHMTVSVYSKQFDCFMGLPAELGTNGVERTFEEDLDESLRKQLQALAARRSNWE